MKESAIASNPLIKLADRLLVAARPPKPSVWAVEHYHLPGGPWSFGKFEYLRAVMDDDAPRIVVKKSSQKGFTEAAMIWAFYGLDVVDADTLYLFPLIQMASDWSAGRFNLACRMSPRLKKLFTDVDNVAHKRAGTVNFYCRGSNSPAQLESIPVSRLVIDEYDRMHRGHYDSVALARRRMNAAKDPREMDLGTPTFPDFGISEEFDKSTRFKRHFRCPRCNRWELPSWPESLEWMDNDPATVRGVCKQCKGNFTQEELLSAENEWIAEDPTRTIHGYHVSGIISPIMPWSKIVQNFLEADGNPKKEQVFYNGDLGESYTAKGTGLTDEHFTMCLGDRRNGEKLISPCVMGVDVGSYLNFEITHYDDADRAIVLYAGKCRDFETLASIFTEWQCCAGIVDALPETREARAFRDLFPGQVWLCYYADDAKSEVIINEGERTITVDRTAIIDKRFARYRTIPPTILLPRDIDEEYKNHHKALKRVLTEKADGKEVYRYVRTKDDHYAHAGVYSELASRFVVRDLVEIWE